MLIDDFASGPDGVTLFATQPTETPGWKRGDYNHSAGITTSPKFPRRYASFTVKSALTHQPGVLDVGKGERLTLGTGPRVHHFLMLGYGMDAQGQQTGQINDLSAFTGFRLNFDFSSLGLNINILFYTTQGTIYFQAGQNINPVLTAQNSAAVPINFPFSSFGKGGSTPPQPPTATDLHKVESIRLQIQSHTLWPGAGFILRSFELY
ncbi:MAG: hypothetical protein U0Y68_02530 [Blastocatellia bacterium]